jgi:DNA-3-methyladenine glycosylase II
VKRHEAKIRIGGAQLGRNDAVMRVLIRRCPPLTSLKLARDRFGMLVGSILSQQISVHAARTIRARLAARVGDGGILPERIAGLSLEEFREIGVSRVKAAYLKDLADKTISGEVSLGRIGRRSDDQVVRELTAVKGIGVWTAQMFLIFSLGRLDVLPYDDYGIRSAIHKLYSLDELPNKETCRRIAEPWRPYATVGTWYLWRSHELDRRQSGGT